VAKRKYDSMTDVWVWRLVSERLKQGCTQELAIARTESALENRYGRILSASQIWRRYKRCEKRLQSPEPWRLRPLERLRRKVGRPKDSLYPDAVRDMEIYELYCEKLERGYGKRRALRTVEQEVGLNYSTVRSIVRHVRKHPLWAKVYPSPRL